MINKIKVITTLIIIVFQQFNIQEQNYQDKSRKQKKNLIKVSNC